jgi:hypothetical protein
MRIQEILIESHQLDEGPILNKIGSAVGKGVGALAKGVGAVAGGVAGLGAAAKKGFQAGKATVASAGDDADPAAGGAAAGAGGAAGAKPAAGSGGTSTKPKGFLAGVKAGQSQGLSAFNDPNVVGSSTPAGSSAGAADDEDPAPTAGATTPPSATDINKAGPKGTAQAKPIQGTVAKQAAAKTGAALAGQDQAQAGQTMYTQVKANIDKLDKKGKQRILQLLQKSMAAPAAKPAAGAAPAAAPAATPAPAAEPTAPAAAAPEAPAAEPTAAAPANTMANAPVSKTNTAKPGNPNAAPAAEPAAAPSADPTAAPAAPTKTGGKVAGQVSQTPGAIAKRAKRTAASSSKTAGAGAFGQMAKQAQTAGKINTGSLVLEGFSLFRKK